MGGGRGEHCAVWAGSGVRAIDLDRSAAMLRFAARLPGVIAIQGDSSAVPLEDESVALVTFHLSIHYGEWRRAVAEAARVLRPGGHCRIWTLGPTHHRSSNLARWFPSVPAIDQARFPDPDALWRALSDVGLTVRSNGLEVEPVGRTAGSWIEAVEAGFVSTLQLLPPGELERGLAAFRRAHPDPDEIITYELRLDWAHAVR